MTPESDSESPVNSYARRVDGIVTKLLSDLR